MCVILFFILYIYIESLNYCLHKMGTFLTDFFNYCQRVFLHPVLNAALFGPWSGLKNNVELESESAQRENQTTENNQPQSGTDHSPRTVRLSATTSSVFSEEDLPDYNASTDDDSVFMSGSVWTQSTFALDDIPADDDQLPAKKVTNKEDYSKKKTQRVFGRIDVGNPEDEIPIMMQPNVQNQVVFSFPTERLLLDDDDDDKKEDDSWGEKCCFCCCSCMSLFFD